jgi:hypothetical protein
MKERTKETTAKQSEKQVYDANGTEWLKIDCGDFANSIDLRIALFRLNDPIL